MLNHHFFLPFFFFFFFFICCSFNKHGVIVMAQNTTSTTSSVVVHVGLVLDLGSQAGKRSHASISMAVEDFYASHTSYKTKILVHSRDSKQDVIGAASAALDLMNNTQAQVIIGPYRSSQAEFVIDLGNKTQVPIISFSATSPALAPVRTPYFIRTTNNDSSQVAAISAFVNSFGWREVVPVYEDSSFGSGIIPYLVDAFQSIGAKVPYRSVISPLVNDDELSEELNKLMTMQTTVFIVHMEPYLASRLFSKANEIGLMEEGYVWIMTDGIGNMLNSLDRRTLEAMEGAVAVRSYMPAPEEIENFTRRWKAKFQQENPSSKPPAYPSVFELRAYDTFSALAMAVENATISSSSLRKLRQGYNSTDLGGLSVSQNGPELLEAILSTSFRGISGEFVLVNGQLNSSVYEIVNVHQDVVRRIAFWTTKFGISKQFNSTSSVSLKSTVIWPGDTTSLPKGWEMPRNPERKLKVLVPVKNGFNEFVRVAHDNTTNRTTFTGFCIDVFEAVMQLLPYAVPYEYIPYPNVNGQTADNYTEMIYQVYLQKFDAVVGDTTIIASRSNYVDFTLPYTQSGVSMIVPVKDERNMWIFLAPLSRELWLWTIGFFLFIGFVLCLIEPRINQEFQGPPLQQLGMIFYFSFSTLTFAHKERLVSNLSRIVVLIWVFIVLILTSAYTASLTSLLTVPPLEPTVTDMSELIKNHKSVGYQDGSFVAGLLKESGFKDDQLKNYSSLEQYIEALDKGEVAAIFDDIPSLKLFISHNCPSVAVAGKNVIGITYKAAHVAMVGKAYKTDGFGFVFPLGSPLARDVSRAILSLTQSDKMTTIEREWFGDVTSCPHGNDNDSGSSNLKFRSFGGLFLITGVVTGVTFFLRILMYCFQNRDELNAAVATENSVGKKVIAWIKHYDKRQLPNSPTTTSIARRIDDVQADTASNLSGFSSQVDMQLSYMNRDTLGEGMLSVELVLPSIETASNQSAEITGD